MSDEVIEMEPVIVEATRIGPGLDEIRIERQPMTVIWNAMLAKWEASGGAINVEIVPYQDHPISVPLADGPPEVLRIVQESESVNIADQLVRQVTWQFPDGSSWTSNVYEGKNGEAFTTIWVNGQKIVRVSYDDLRTWHDYPGNVVPSLFPPPTPPGGGGPGGTGEL